jgi:phosphohistidine phosphatase
MRLSLLRHGIAETHSDTGDFERMLTPRGSEQARWAADRLQSHGAMLPDRVLCSPARRTRQTAESLLKALTLPPTCLELMSPLYLADLGTLTALIQGIAIASDAAVTGPTRHILLVGHNPGLSELAQHLGAQLPTHELAAGALVSGEINDAGIVSTPFALLT